MYKVFIKTSPSSSSVEVSRLQELEQAISFGFQLHNVSTSKHYIEVQDDDSKQVASFIRQDAFTLPAKKEENPAPKKQLLNLRKRDS